MKNFFGGFPGGRFIGKEELESVSGVLQSRTPYRFYGLSDPTQVSALENTCCEVFQRKYSLAVTSGTAALQAALFAVGVSEGDEVIVPAYGWGSDLMAILDRGAVPVIAPLDDTWGLDTGALEGCISDRTRAILAIHMRGSPCQLSRVCEIAQTRGIRVIEDGAQCMGGLVGGRPVGSTGDVSILSFQYHKLVTAGEGGVVLTDNSDFYERAYRFHDLGMFRRSGDPDPEGLESLMTFGLNLRMGEMHAAVLLAQFKKIPHILARLKQVYGLGLDAVDSVCKKFSLCERRLIDRTERNHAFLCFTAENRQSANQATQALVEQDVPVQQCGRIDAHHFRAWEAFLKRDRRPYRLIATDQDSDLLERSLFVEINAECVDFG